MKKILHWNPRFGNSIGGGEIYISNIIQNMPGFEHLVLSDKILPEVRLKDYEQFEKNILYSAPPNIMKPKWLNFPINVIMDIMKQKGRKNIYKKLQPDLNIIHGLGLFGSLERLKFLTGIDLIGDDYFSNIEPKILTVHNLYSPIMLKNDSRYSNYETNLFKQFETFICIDKNIFTHIKAKYPSKEVHFIPNSIPEHFFNNRLHKKRFDPKEPVVGFVGRFEYSRGIHILKRLVVESPNNFKFIFVFSASPSNKQKINDEFSSNTRVKLFFNIPNVLLPDYYRKMDFLFNPVLAQGISRVSLEAMAMGVIPLMLDIGDRYPIKDFKTGILFVEPKLDELIDKVKNISSAEYYEIQKNAMVLAKEKFSNYKIIPKLVEIYKKSILHG